MENERLTDELGSTGVVPKEPVLEEVELNVQQEINSDAIDPPTDAEPSNGLESTPSELIEEVQPENNTEQDIVEVEPQESIDDSTSSSIEELSTNSGLSPTDLIEETQPEDIKNKENVVEVEPIESPNDDPVTTDIEETSADTQLTPSDPLEDTQPDSIIEQDKDTEEIESLPSKNDSTAEVTDSSDEETKSENVESVEEPFVEVDYSSLPKEELLEAIKNLLDEENPTKFGKPLNEIKSVFDGLVATQKSEALDQFKADGGEEDAFEYQADKIEADFYANIKLLRDKRHHYYKNLEHQKETNLKIKNEILEELRELVDGEETVTGLKIIKGIQEKWRSAGTIPRQHNRNLWANYNALMDRFYDNRGIYFELKDLDKKKNLELKTEICVKAEALGIENNINKAVGDVKHLHEEFKHIGSVPEDNQEELWIRFKAATDAIYSNRNEFVDELKDKQVENFAVKNELCEKILVLASFTSDQMSEWNEKTRELLDIQKKWEATGGVSREKVKGMNKQFWSSFKAFFSNKSKFFKTLDGQREDNLKLKEELVDKVEALKDSTDISNAADQIKKLQVQWREIGPVPEKSRKASFKRFKEVCDYFFNRRRETVKETEKEFYENLKRKQEICTQLDEIINSETIDLDKIEELQSDYSKVGFVPRDELKKMGRRYDSIVNKVIEKVNQSELKDKDQIAFEILIKQEKGRPDAGRSLQKQESQLRHQITTIENNVSTWQNNLEFFRSSKTADKLRVEFDLKIEASNNELKLLKQQLKMMAQD